MRRWWQAILNFLRKLFGIRTIAPAPLSLPGEYMIAIVNQSTRGPVTIADLQAMVEVCNHQIKYHVGPAYGRNPAQVVLASSPDTVPVNAVPVYILNDSDQAGALGYHTEDSRGRVYARVFVSPVLDNGGGWLSDNGKGFSVSSVLSHEVIELFVDPNVNLWADGGDGNLYAVEACDPVESDSYTLKASDGRDVVVSNFVFPEWFDVQAPVHARFDHLRKVSRPFTMDPGGYLVYMQGGQVQQKFGAKYPAWRKATKKSEASRTYRRTH